MALVEGTSPEVAYDPSEQIDRTQRIRIIKDEQGFIPTSYDEITEALALQSFPQKRGGAGSHLNEILLRQIKLKKSYEEQAETISSLIFMECEPLAVIDPQSTVRSVVRQYTDWYADAAEGFCSLVELAEAVHNTDKPTLNIREVAPNHPGLPYLARYYSLMQEAYYKPENSENSPYKDEFFSFEDGEPEATRTALDEISVRVARQLVPEAAADQGQRFNCWEQALLSSIGHLAARAIATTALRTYGSALQ